MSEDLCELVMSSSEGIHHDFFLFLQTISIRAFLGTGQSYGAALFTGKIFPLKCLRPSSFVLKLILYDNVLLT